MSVLSIQSHTAAGHVGNDAAVFCLERLGIPVMAVHTLQFSNHTGRPFQGMTFDAEHLTKVIDGIENFCGFSACNAVLSGYLGKKETGQVVLNAVQKVKKDNPNALYCCDPVMGDEQSGLFVKEEIADFFINNALDSADILTPNQFELEILSKKKSETLSQTIDSAQILRKKHKISVIAVTSLKIKEISNDETAVLVVADEGCFYVKTPKVPFKEPLTGTGDMFSAIFLAHLLSGKNTSESLAFTVSSLFGIIKKTAANKERETALIAFQNDLVSPEYLFPAILIER